MDDLYGLWGCLSIFESMISRFSYRVGGELIILSRQSLVEFYSFGLMEIATKLLGKKFSKKEIIF